MFDGEYNSGDTVYTQLEEILMANTIPNSFVVLQLTTPLYTLVYILGVLCFEFAVIIYMLSIIAEACTTRHYPIRV